MPCGYLMRSALPPPASSWKRFLPYQIPAAGCPEGHQPHAARRFLQQRRPAERSRYIGMYVQRYFNGGVCRLSL